MELVGVEGTNPIPNTEHDNKTTFSKDQNHQQDLSFDILHFNFKPPLHQPIEEPKRLMNQKSSLASLELLRNYENRFKKLRIQQNLAENSENYLIPQKLSTEEIIRLAGARYIQHSSQWNDNIFIPIHPYGFCHENLSEQENRDIELVQFLLAVAERVSCQQFERARMLLLHFQLNPSCDGNPVQRVIFHLARALRERINKESAGGRIKGYEKNKERELIEKLEFDEINMAITCHKKIPFNQVMQFTGVQAIVENVASKTKIHLIDLDIGCGVLCTVLMQALADRKGKKVELLKITAIGISGATRLEETGKRLMSFAQSLNLPFSYNLVFVRDFIEIKLDQFEIEDDEVVAIYSPYLLRTMVSNSDSLENLMRVMRSIRPCIMIVLELEANHNSPSFVNRFIEALFFYSAYFDCVETCLKEDYVCRMRIEMILSEGIRSIVAMEDRGRKVRNVKIDVWRRFFARYRMVETGFSESSLYQANLVAKKFDCGNFCTIQKNGKCLIVGWKGTPIHSISAWKFL